MQPQAPSMSVTISSTTTNALLCSPNITGMLTALTPRQRLIRVHTLGGPLSASQPPTGAKIIKRPRPAMMAHAVDWGERLVVEAK